MFDCIHATTMQVSLKAGKPTSLNNHQPENLNYGKVTLFPNPGNGALSIGRKTSNVGPFSVTVFNPSGKKVHEKPNCQKSDTNIDLTSLPNGAYLAHLTFSTHTETHKVVIRH